MFNDPFCSQISSGTLIAENANNQLFGTLQQLGRASTHFSDGHSHLSASLMGKFAKPFFITFCFDCPPFTPLFITLPCLPPFSPSFMTPSYFPFYHPLCPLLTPYLPPCLRFVHPLFTPCVSLGQPLVYLPFHTLFFNPPVHSLCASISQHLFYLLFSHPLANSFFDPFLKTGRTNFVPSLSTPCLLFLLLF